MIRRLVAARRRLRLVEFCDACGSVWDARCRARRLKETERLRALQAGGIW